MATVVQLVPPTIIVEARKPVLGIFDQVRHKQACTPTEEVEKEFYYPCKQQLMHVSNSEGWKRNINYTTNVYLQ